MPTALITGGASWFSRETSRMLIAEGWSVALGEINEKNLAEVLGELNSPKATGGKLDVTDLASVRAFVDKAAKDNGSIDALVNVAGGTNYLGMPRLPFVETKPENWDLVLKPNLYGTLNC